jgi:hypothetical protein
MAVCQYLNAKVQKIFGNKKEISKIFLKYPADYIK